jgi:tetratricopeptide (TPR) repeat protein
MPLALAILLAADAAALVAAGDKAAVAHDLRSALFSYQDAIREEPGSPIVLVRLGEMYSRMGHDSEALESFAKALRYDPKNAAAKQGIAAARERLVMLAPLPPAPRVVEAPAPKAVDVPAPKMVDEAGARERYTTAVRLINERRYADALAALDDALQKKPGYPVALVARGSAQMGLLHYDAAAADYSAARTADPSLASPLFGLAEAYRALGQGTKAAQLYREYATSGAADVQQPLKEYALRNAQLLASQ